MPSATFELTGSTWYMPLGRSVSSKNSASRSAPIGVALAGFTTIGAPTASAGATLCATRFSGKLNGVMPSTGPIGNRRRMPDPRAERGLGVQPHQPRPGRGGASRRPTGTSRPRAPPRPAPTSAACRPRRRSAGRSPPASRRAGGRCGRAPSARAATDSFGDSSNVAAAGGDRFLDVGLGRARRARRRPSRRRGSAPRTCPRRSATARSPGTGGCRSCRVSSLSRGHGAGRPLGRPAPAGAVRPTLSRARPSRA